MYSSMAYILICFTCLYALAYWLTNKITTYYSELTSMDIRLVAILAMVTIAQIASFSAPTDEHADIQRTNTTLGLLRLASTMWLAIGAIYIHMFSDLFLAADVPIQVTTLPIAVFVFAFQNEFARYKYKLRVANAPTIHQYREAMDQQDEHKFLERW